MELLFLNTILQPQGIFHLCFFLLLSQELVRNDAPVSTLALAASLITGLVHALCAARRSP